MNTDLLISKIIDEGAKKPLARPHIQAAYWLSGALIYIFGLCAYNGFRPDLYEKLSTPLYGLELFFLGLMSVSTALAALCLARPDVHQKSWIKVIPFVLFMPWAMIAYFNSSGHIDFESLYSSLCASKFDCPWHIAIFSIPPGACLFYIIRKAAPIQCCWAGTMATWSVASLAYIAMRIAEQNDNLAHLIIWHALPVMLMCMVGMVLGKISLKWR